MVLCCPSSRKRQILSRFAPNLRNSELEIRKSRLVRGPRFPGGLGCAQKSRFGRRIGEGGRISLEGLRVLSCGFRVFASASLHLLSLLCTTFCIADSRASQGILPIGEEGDRSQETGDRMKTPVFCSSFIVSSLRVLYCRFHKESALSHQLSAIYSSSKKVRSSLLRASSQSSIDNCPLPSVS
jgi:hypothetical protein